MGRVLGAKRAACSIAVGCRRGVQSANGSSYGCNQRLRGTAASSSASSSSSSSSSVSHLDHVHSSFSTTARGLCSSSYLLSNDRSSSAVSESILLRSVQSPSSPILLSPAAGGRRVRKVVCNSGVKPATGLTWSGSKPDDIGSNDKRMMSTYIADEIREEVTRQGIKHIYGKKSRSMNDVRDDADSVNISTLGSSMDFVFDIELKRKPTDRYLDRGYGYAVSPDIDPFDLVESEISGLSGAIKELLGTDHPVLSAAAKYFFEVDGGKKVRPTMVMLMSYACNHHVGREEGKLPTERVLACQRRLAEIAEMVHTASLFHDDVIDKADTRRGVPSVNKVFGNKLAILAGDFLLARATISLARLRSFEAVELMALTIDNLVKGEILQMKPIVDGVGAFEHYVCKNYYKTGSLMANSCKAASAVADHDPEVQAIAHEYGKRVGLAFQLVDDVLDFEGNIFSLGKPALNDLQQGLATAPVLLAVDEQPHLAQLIARKFNGPGDVDEALAAVQASDGIQRTKDIAHVQAELAIEAVLKLAPSSERDALVNLAYKMVNRKH